MNYREYANQRANEMDLLVSTFAPENKDLMCTVTTFLRDSSKMDKIYEKLKVQIEKIFGREVHWAEMDWIANVITSIVTTDSTCNNFNIYDIMEKSLRLLGVPEEELDDIIIDLNNLVNDITNKVIGGE